MEANSKKYTAFALPGLGLYHFKRLPFGLVNAPMLFQRLIDAICGPELEPYVFCYLDDILVIAETFEEHLKYLELVLRRLMDAGLSINRAKCKFGCSRVAYLGFLLDRDGLRTNPDKVAPVLNYPVPRNVRQLRRFLGMVGWYSRFIPKDSELKIPLVKLLRNNQAWEWELDQQRAFEKLKTALTEAPVLARPDFQKPFKIQSDASNGAIGAVLTQELEDGEHPIVFISRVLTAAERNYSTTERECLAVVWAIKKFRPYVEGYNFTVITDHSALKWLRNLKEPTGRLARWALELQQWTFEIVHRKGSLHQVPDALSRMYEDEERVHAFATITDEWYVKRRSDVQAHPNKFPAWRVENDCLYRFRRDALLDPVTNPEEGWRLVVPKEQRDRVMHEAHAIASSGHLGIEKTQDRITRDYYWPGMNHDIYEYVRTCQLCQRYKIPQTGPQGLMGDRVVEQPWTIVAADMMEFPTSKNRMRYVIVFQDLFTKWVEMRAMRKADGKSVANAFAELVLFRWETPRYLLTDNGTEFDNRVLAKTLTDYGVIHVTTPPYHPQANPVERANRTIKTMVSTFVQEDHREWDLHLHELQHAINTAVQASTKVSPAFLNYGRHPTPVKSLRREVEAPRPVIRLDESIWTDRLKRLEGLRDLVTRHLEEARDRQRGYYDRGRKNVRFNVGDLVMRRNHPLSRGTQGYAAKLAPKFQGPYEVVEVKSPVVVTLYREGDGRNTKAHISQLKPYHPPLARGD